MGYLVVRQHSEEDCGAAALATIAKYHKKTFSLTRIRDVIGTGQLGTNLLGLRQGAESLGFNARSVKAAPEIVDRINEAPLPAIIHWKGNHWVILYGKKGRKFVIGDPGVGVRYISKLELLSNWKNLVMLLLEPGAEFDEIESDRVKGLWRFTRRVIPYWSSVVQAIFAAQIIGLFSLATPFMIQILTDEVLIRRDTELLTLVIIGVSLSNVITSAIGLFVSYLVAYLAQRLELSLSLDFALHILKLPLSYFETRRSGEITSRLQDIQEINQLISRGIVALPSQFFVALISLAVMCFYSQKLTLVAGGVLILITLSTLVLLPMIRHKVRSYLVLDTENQGLLVEVFKGAATLKTTNSIPHFRDEFQTRFGKLSRNAYQLNQLSIINNVMTGFVSQIGNIGILWYGSVLVIGNQISIGQLLAFTSLSSNVLGFMSTLVEFAVDLTQVSEAQKRLSEVIDAPPEEERAKKFKPHVELFSSADVVCTKLKFHYSGRAELLENFSLSIPGGRTTAIIGKSGCGKSTLVKLISGLYKINEGSIHVGFYNLKDVCLTSWRSQVVIVPQEAHFFSRSVTDNFTLSSSVSSFEDIVRACRVTCADEFIQSFPDGYQTVLGEFGATLSGGQRQRLALARAIVDNPPVLILDESTSALDVETETRVMNQLLEYRKGKTTIIISHRPRIQQMCDCLVELESGTVKQLQMAGVK